MGYTLTVPNYQLCEQISLRQMNGRLIGSPTVDYCMSKIATFDYSIITLEMCLI